MGNDLNVLYIRVAYVDADDAKKWDALKDLFESGDNEKGLRYMLRNCKIPKEKFMRESYTDFIGGDEVYTSPNGRYVMTFSDIMVESVSLYERAPRLYK